MLTFESESALSRIQSASKYTVTNWTPDILERLEALLGIVGFHSDEIVQVSPQIIHVIQNNNI